MLLCLILKGNILIDKKIVILIIFFLPVFSVFCLGGKEQTQINNSVKVAFSFGAEWLEVYQAMEDMFLIAIEESGVSMDVQFWYADGDGDREATNIRKAIVSEPDILVLMPLNSEEILLHIESAHRKEIPVIVYNRQQAAHDTIKPDAYVGLDTFDQAYTTAIALFKLMHQESYIIKAAIILGDLADRNAINRRKGFYRAAEEMDAEIVIEIESFWDAKKAALGFKKALDEKPEINALLLSSDFMMDEVQKILINKERWFPYGDKRHLFIGSQDTFSNAIPLIKARYIDVDTAFDIWPMSTTLVQVINTLVSGNHPGQDVFLIPGRVVINSNVSEMEDLWSLQD